MLAFSSYYIVPSSHLAPSFVPRPKLPGQRGCRRELLKRKVDDVLQLCDVGDGNDDAGGLRAIDAGVGERGTGA